MEGERDLQNRHCPTPPRLVSRSGRRRSIDADGAGTGEGDAPLPTIEGYASVFWNDQPTTQYMLYDDLAERIMPGCFDRAMKEDDVRALFNHDASFLLGRNKSGTLRLSTDRTGLKYSIDPGETVFSRAVVDHLRRGDVTGSSFSFIPTEVLWREEDALVVREIHDVILFDVGPVTYPAYEATTSGLRCSRSLGRAPASMRQGIVFGRRERLDRDSLAATLAYVRRRADEVAAQVARDGLSAVLHSATPPATPKTLQERLASYRRRAREVSRF